VRRTIPDAGMADGAKPKAGGVWPKGLAFDDGKGIKEVAVSTHDDKTCRPATLGMHQN
jgi:sulfite dehydrogenase (cytochrome) subunit A